MLCTQYNIMYTHASTRVKARHRCSRIILRVSCGNLYSCVQVMITQCWIMKMNYKMQHTSDSRLNIPRRQASIAQKYVKYKNCVNTLYAAINFIPKSNRTRSKLIFSEIIMANTNIFGWNWENFTQNKFEWKWKPFSSIYYYHTCYWFYTFTLFDT